MMGPMPVHYGQHSSSGSGEFIAPSPVLPMDPHFGSLPPPAMPVVQGVPEQVLDSLRAEAMAQAQQALGEQREKCNKQVHFARVRVAELEQRLQRAEADGDEMSARLTLVE